MLLLAEPHTPKVQLERRDIDRHGGSFGVEVVIIKEVVRCAGVS